MPDLAEAWAKALPEIKNGVTGVGVWTALNHATPLAIEDGTLYVGVPIQMSDLGGHLRVAHTKRLIKQLLGKELGQTVTVRVVEGNTPDVLETLRRKDAEARRLQDAQMAKMRLEIEARQSWDGIYEQLSRRYAAVPNRSLPQNRARFFEEAVELIAETRKGQDNWDDLAERNFARCIERVAQYCELQSAYVALNVLRKAGEL